MKNSNGITLVVLVITIIVLLILAGISILLSLNDNGILRQATAAVDTNKLSMVKEDLQEAWASLESEYYEKYTLDSSIKRKDIFTKENLNKYLKGIGRVKSFYYNNEGKSNLIYLSNEDNKEYKFSINNQGKLETIENTFAIGSFDEDYSYNNVSILVLDEKFEYKNINIEDDKLIVKGLLDGEVEEFLFDIIKDKYDFNCVDCGEWLGYDEEVPAIMIDSKYRIVKDFSKYNFDDSYCLFAFNSEEELNNLLNGNYITDYGFWVKKWFDKPSINFSQFIGYKGLDTVPYWCYITDKSDNEIYNAGYLQEGFEDALDMIRNIENTKNVSVVEEKIDDSICSKTYETEEYKAKISYTVGYEGSPAFDSYLENGKGGYKYVLLSDILYDISNNIFPKDIRNKETKEYVDSTELEGDFETTNKYEYYKEKRLHILNKGEKIVLK